MKIVFITPHLSSGGMPEYLRKKVELLKSDNEVWVLELRTEWAFRIIRDKIEAMIGKNLVAINDNFEKMWSIIQEINPDVIHFEELSDYHVPYEILDRIYTPDRNWKIFETFHDSSIDSWEKSYLPDKLIVVSPWQQKMMMGLPIPIEVINHEIDTRPRDRSILSQLGLNHTKKHVGQVGLFSPRKNQSETFELARLMPDVDFHFFGNTADNYKFYWEGLLANKPENCHLWYERSDIDRFYQCLDAVIFPSRGQYGDRETNPLVIREAIAWKTPLLVRDLPVYMGMYREGPLVKFMTDDLITNAQILSQMIKGEPQKNNIQTMKLEDNFFKKKLFNITFDATDNKITFEYLESIPLLFNIVVRDIDTEVPIFSFDAQFTQGSSCWCIPIPKAYYDFGGNPNFGGFLYDFYDKIKGQKVYNAATRIKRAAQTKDKFRIESTEPLFINYEQFFTDKIYDKFFQQIPKLNLVVDVGANVGLFTELSKRKGAKKIISLEINKKSIEVFKNLHSTDDVVKLIEMGLSSQTEVCELWTNDGNSLISSTKKSHDNSLQEVQEVNMLGFSDLIEGEGIKKIDLLKIDVEGSEYDIFSGMTGDDLSKVGAIILEFHDNFGGLLNDVIISRLEESGFQYEIYQEDCVGLGNDYEEKGTIFAIKK